MAVTTVVKAIGSTGAFSTVQLWEDGAPADLTASNNWTAGSFTGTFQQGETVTGTGITGGKFLDSNGTNYITFGTTTTPAAGITITGSTSGATCVISGSANVGVIWQGQCQNQEFVVAGTVVTIAGSTASATTYKELTTAAGASFRDNVNAQSNPLRYDATKGAALRGTANTTVTVVCTEANCRVNKLQITATGTNSGAISGGSTTQFLDFLILEGTNTSATVTTGIYGAVSTVIGSFIRNCLFILRTTAADHIIGISTRNPTFINCTIVAPDDLATAPTSIFAGTGLPAITNCGLFAGDSTKAIGGATATFTTCYSDISGTTGVTQTTYANEFQNVLAATRDYRLKSGAAEKNTGTTDATNAANDIIGTARPQGSAYDVGCWEFEIPANIQKLVNAPFAIKRAANY